MKKIFILLISGILFNNIALKAQTYSEILGRPTDTSITMNMMIDTAANLYW